VSIGCVLGPVFLVLTFCSGNKISNGGACALAKALNSNSTLNYLDIACKLCLFQVNMCFNISDLCGLFWTGDDVF